jgi:hypothetical protein
LIQRLLRVMFSPARSASPMIERRQRFRFSLEARESVWIAGKQLGQDLDRHVAIELRIASAIHLAHSTGAQGAEDFVGAESCSWSQHRRI